MPRQTNTPARQDINIQAQSDTAMVAATENAAMVLTPEEMALMAGDTGHAPKFERKDLLTPQLRIIQKTSAYMQRTKQEYIADATDGEFIDTMTLERREGVRLVICQFAVTYTEWGPNQGPLVKQWGTDASGYDRASGDFGTRKTAEGNDIVGAATYYALMVNDDGGSMPVVVYLTGTQYRKSRRLNSLLQSLELPGPNGPFLAPIFARSYDCTTVPESNDQGEWMGWKIDLGPLTLALPNGKAIYAKAKAFKESVDRGEVQAAPPREAENTAAGAAGSTQQTGGQSSQPAVGDDIPF